MSRRLRRGCSLEVIFEEEDCTPFSHLAQPAEDHCFSSPETRPRRVRNKISPGFIALYKRRRSRSLSALLDSSVEVLTEDPNWDIANSEDKGDTEWDHRRAPLSRRQIIERSSFEDLAALLDPQPPKLDLNAPELPLSPPAVVKSPQPCSADSHYECNIRADYLIHCTCGSGRVVFKMVLNSTMPLKHMQAIPESEALPETAGGAGGGPAKRRTSIYEALAMANQVSQGSMTRRYRQFFEEQSQRAKENKGALDVHPGPILNQTIVTAASAHTIKEHELNQMAVPPTEPKKIPKPSSWPAAKEVHIDQKKTLLAGESKVKDFLSSSIGHHSGLRCEVCSAPIQANRAKPEAALSQKEVDVVVPSVEEFDPPSTELACKPTNKEVVEDELPKPNTVKNVRNLFETESDAILPHPYGTFRPASVNSGRFSMGYVKSNPSSKILRSESLSSLNQLPHYHLSRSSSTMSLHSSQPHAVLLTLPKEDIEPLEEKGYVVALGRLAPLRSLSRQERDAVFRSPSPPPYRSGAGAHSHRSLRTSHSIPPEFTPRPYVDSIYSEASEWSSDWDNHSDTASSASVSSPRPGSTSNHSSDGVRYIAPDVLERIRSYGLTFQFVDGKMVSSDNDDPESAPVPTSMRQKSEAPAPKPKVTAVKSAAPQVPAKKKGSALTPTPKSTKNTLGKTVSAPLPMTTAHALEKVSSIQPRVISYVPKASTPYTVVTTTTTAERVRHCSGDSSASSSGVSSVAQRSDSASSESESVGGSPFCSLKRVKKRDLTSNDNAFFERDGRPCSPGPVECPSVKSVAESIYGMYSVMYNFRHSQVTPHIKV